jgi:murein L,D-transpeptidase YafK
MRDLHRATVALALLALAIGCAKAVPAPPPPPVPAPPAPAPPPPCERVARIEVAKSARMLTAECDGGARLVFPVALARERGPKQRAGDLRMPEGEYRIAGAARASRFGLFLPIDYPSTADAARGLVAGVITREEHDAIVHAHERSALPPQDTALGGHLGLHGEGTRWRGDLDLDWTEGCVALADEAIDRLARLVARGPPVQIIP